MDDPIDVDDQLSAVLDLVGVRAAMSRGLVASEAWTARASGHGPLELLAVVQGRVRLRTDGAEGPVELEPGDVAILNERAWVELSGGADLGARRVVAFREWRDRVPLFDADYGDADVVIGVRVDLDPTGRALLSQALPPLGLVRSAAAPSANLRCSLDRLFEESTGHRAGSEFAIRQYSQLLVLNVLRAYLAETSLPPGWLRLLGDERLRPAVSRMHADPGARWTLEQLARAAMMSRTSFADRFRAVAGVPPLAYLNQWRMLLARRALRDRDVLVGELGYQLGYASESAFSKAFKREVRESPLQYRHRLRTGPSSGSSTGFGSPGSPISVRSASAS